MRVELINHPVHGADQAQTIIETAGRIAADAAIPDDLRPQAFSEACRLLGARITGAIPAPDAADLIAAGLVRNGA